MAAAALADAFGGDGGSGGSGESIAANSASLTGTGY